MKDYCGLLYELLVLKTRTISVYPGLEGLGFRGSGGAWRNNYLKSSSTVHAELRVQGFSGCWGFGGFGALRVELQRF